MRFHTVLMALAMCVACTMADDKSALKQVSESSNLFAVNFFKAIASEKKNENLISSPLSAHVILSMAAYGAGGMTAQQMRASLNLPSENSVGRQGFKNLIDNLNQVENVTLEVANKMYLAQEFKLKPEFKQLTKASFRSEASAFDTQEPEKSAKLVNDWVVEKTHSKIKDIIQPSDITSDTRLVLLNAVYFKGQWAQGFKKELTTDKPFFYMENNVKKEKSVPMMYAEKKFFYGELPELKAKFVMLPYLNKNLQMVIIVPNEVDGLSKIESKLEDFNYQTLEEYGSSETVKLYLPKFKIESEIDLKAPLEKLGMTDMFSSHANFSGISDESLKVSKVIQKAFIEVNEEGSEAAAVTGLQAVALSVALFDPEFVVDKPFLFMIRDTSSRVTLFKGHVVRP